jgi:hypothetical protein
MIVSSLKTEANYDRKLQSQTFMVQATGYCHYYRKLRSTNIYSAGHCFHCCKISQIV